MKLPAAAALALAATTGAEARERVSVAPPAMQAIAPALADYTDEVLFGDVWLRPELSPRDRSLVTLSVLIATGKTAQLPGHLGRGLANGVKPAEVAGIVTHLAFYTGWPNAVSSLGVIETVFAERKIDMAALKAATSAQLPTPPHPQADAAAGRLAPKLAELTDGVLFGNLWRRSDLSPRDRSLVTLAALAANGETEQLALHVRRGIDNGLTSPEIGEAFTHLAFYAGWPKATAAVDIAARTFGPRTDNSSAALPDKVRVVAPGQNPTAGPPSRFTGSVTVTSAFRGTGAARLGGGTVTFQPGARSNWHSHSLGQLLVVTEGNGWVQAEGEPVRVVKQGDTVWTAPGVKHWHGATPAGTMTHVAIAETDGSDSVTWLEPVSDGQYRAPG